MSNLQQHKQDPDMSAPVVVNIKRNINQMMEGALNACGTVTLTNGGTTTVLQDNRISLVSKIFLFPQTAHAAAITGLFPDYTTIPTVGPIIGGKITLTHSSSAQADLTFSYVIFT